MAIQQFVYDHTESIPASALEIGDVIVRPRHPDRPYRVVKLFTLRPTGRINVWAQSVYAARGMGPFDFGRFTPEQIVTRAVVEP